jgi:uncharacterized membrane protein YidH (DUF202 family)
MAGMALERTFLDYLRTSLALVMTGVITVQLFRLQHTVAPDPRIGFFVLGTTCRGTVSPCLRHGYLVYKYTFLT